MIQGGPTGQGGDASRAGGHALFADDLEQSDLARIVQWVPPQSSLLNWPMATMRTTSGYFSPNSIIAPAFRASASGMLVERIGLARENFGVDLVLDANLFLAADGRRIGEVEPQPIVVDLRALLQGMLAEMFLQGMVQQVRGGVCAADALAAVGIDPGGHQAPSEIFPSRRCPRWSVKAPSIWASITSRWNCAAGDLADIAHLAAHFAVEGRFVEHHDDRLFVVELVELLAQLIAGDDADHLGVGHFDGFRSRRRCCRASPF